MATAINNFGFTEDAPVSQSTAAPNNFGFTEDVPTQSQSNPSLAPRVAADIDTGFLNAARGIINAPSSIGNIVAGAINPNWSNTFAPVTDVPGNLINKGLGAINQNLSNSIPSVSNANFGSMLGVNSPNIGDSFLQGAAQYAPFGAVSELAAGLQGLPKAASYLDGVLQRIPSQSLGAGLFGATQNQNNAAEGGVAGIALGALNAVVPGGGAVLDAIRPQKYVGTIIDGITNQLQNAKQMYQPVFDAVGNKSIYSSVPQAQGAYSALDDSVINSYPGSLKNLNTNFNQNPTFENAHALQSQLGSLVGKLQQNDAKGTLSMADRYTMENLQDARNSLRTDMDQYLQGVDPGLSDQYANATQNWSANVAPYMGQQNIAKAVNQNIANPDINTTISPEKMLSSLGKINGTPTGLAGQMDSLKTKIGFRNLAQRGIGIGLGAYMFPGAEEAGALVGGALAPQIARGLSGIVPTNQIRQRAATAATAVSPYLRQSFIANADPMIANGLAATPPFINDLQNK